MFHMKLFIDIFKYLIKPCPQNVEYYIDGNESFKGSETMKKHHSKNLGKKVTVPGSEPMKWKKEDAYARISTARIGSLDPERVTLEYLSGILDGLTRWKSRVQEEVYRLEKRIAREEAGKET